MNGEVDMSALLNVYCTRHPRYRGVRQKKRNPCVGCALLFILRHQHEPDADAHLGGLNPYQFLPGTEEDGCGMLRVRPG